MKFISKLGSLTITTAVVSAFSLLPIVDSSFDTGLFSNTEVFAADDEGPRAPPPTRSSQQMSKRVYQRIEEVVEFQELEQYSDALNVLAELKEMYNDDRLNDREKYMMWVFYANIAQSQEKYGEALSSYAEILELENMRAGDIEQALRISGQLSFIEERYQAALDYYLRLIDYTLEPDSNAHLRVSMAHYQLENYSEAIPYMERHIELERAAGKDIPESTYSLLGAIYYTLGDYQSTRQVIRERIVLFNSPSDWGFLAGLNGQLDDFNQQAHLYYVANIKGYLDSEGLLLNLAAQMFNNDNPYGGAKIIQAGMDAGVIEQNTSNLSFLSTTYQIAREDKLAIDPLLQAASMSDDGKLYARLGNIYSNLTEFDKAVDAFKLALEKGGLDRTDSVYLWQARAFRELNRFDEGVVVARLAGRDDRSKKESATWVKLLTREKEIYESRVARRAELAGYFR